MPRPVFHCAFCQQTSSRTQGLAAHIRNRHPKQYPKWLKTPSRLADAQKTVTPVAARPAPKAPAELQAVHTELSSVPAVAPNPALDLLKRAHAQLIERKQSIEAELARMADLTKELEAVNAQIQALDKTLGVFEPRPVQASAAATR